MSRKSEEKIEIMIKVNNDLSNIKQNYLANMEVIREGGVRSFSNMSFFPHDSPFCYFKVPHLMNFNLQAGVLIGHLSTRF